MDSNGLKTAAETALREMPHVVGAFVQPDAFGHPREIHLLIGPGPKPREFAHEVKTLLETRLRLPIDQRIISIAQLANDAAPEPPPEPAAVDARAPEPPASYAPSRIRLENVETRVRGGRVTVTVSLQLDGVPLRGEAREFEAEEGRARAGARAALAALNDRVEGRGRFGFEFAAAVAALDQRYVLVSLVASGIALGRRPVALAGAHPADEGEETAAVLAVLKATNRSLEILLAEDGPPSRRRRPLPDV